MNSDKIETYISSLQKKKERKIKAERAKALISRGLSDENLVLGILRNEKSDTLKASC